MRFMYGKKRFKKQTKRMQQCRRPTNNEFTVSKPFATRDSQKPQVEFPPNPQLFSGLIFPKPSVYFELYAHPHTR